MKSSRQISKSLASEALDALTRIFNDENAVIEHHSKTFYFATSFLSTEKRRQIRILYSFCRLVDDIADEQTAQAPEILEEIKHQLQSSEPSNKLIAGFKTEVIEKNHVPIKFPLDLVEGCLRDLTQNRYETFSDLKTYCYQVASTVGLMSCYILGFDENFADEVTDNAVNAGIALQLTNILRDVGEDLKRGRIYLAREDFVNHGCNIDNPEEWRNFEGYKTLIKDYIQRTRKLYDGSFAALCHLKPSARISVGLALTVYKEILKYIEKNDYDNLSKRAFVPTVRKFAIVVPTIFALMKNEQNKKA